MGLGDTHVGLLLSWFLISCAHPPPAPVSAPAPVAAPAKPDPFAVTAEWKPEAAEAPEAFWVRIKSPAQLLPRALKLAADPSLMGFSDLKAMAGLLLGGELSALIDFDAPMTVVFVKAANKQNPPFVTAVQLNDVAHFAPQRLGEKLQPVGPGRWELVFEDLTHDLRCELWHAAAPIGYRIVCGANDEEIARNAPFLLDLAKQPLTLRRATGVQP
ncbi:MAG TPA: hypothetical protein VG937_35415 [Polyangiaceae bacterium]|nr:hypothetical protein [Polyangiaceae bacterium]